MSDSADQSLTTDDSGPSQEDESQRVTTEQIIKIVIFVILACILFYVIYKNVFGKLL